VVDARIDPLALERHRGRLWALCFRITGVAADADELVQETFVRALASPPHDLSRELAPWLVRVATNASRDLLRRRKTQSYVGPWLPSPLDVDALAAEEEQGPDARYGLAESLSFAFLIALETLSPTQRAVLVLRDALGYSVREVAEALCESEANVKTTHHRARKALEAYEASREQRHGANLVQARAAVSQLLAQLATGDLQSIARALAEDVELVSDGGGEFLAALRPIVSRERVARCVIGVQRDVTPHAFLPVTLGALPALLVTGTSSRPRAASRSASLFEVNREGVVARIYIAVATRKIAHLAFGA